MEILPGLPAGAVQIGSNAIAAAQTVPVGREPAPLSAFNPPSTGTVEFKTPDGTRIVLQKPKNSGIAVSEIMRNVQFESQYLMETYRLKVRALLSVVKINGDDQVPPSNAISYAALDQKLGDDMADYVMLAYIKSWPPVDDGQLEFVGKS